MTGRTTDHEYPPEDWRFDGLKAALEKHRETEPLPRYENADAWEECVADPLTAPFVEAIRSRAARIVEEPPAPLLATTYLEFERTGDRTAYERAYFGRQKNLSALALAECVEREGRYLDAILDYAWAVCEQATWLLPPHLPDEERAEGLPRPTSSESHHVALFSARTALLLAELDRLLGDRLHPTLRERLRTEVDDRVFTPSLENDHHWLHPPVGNWNAVCNAAVATAALHLEPDIDRLARLVHQATGSLRHYLGDFGADGCTPEGVGYWDFGVCHYLVLSAALSARTGGAYDLLSPPILREIAQYPRRVELSPGRFVPFSDAHEAVDVSPFAACRLGDRLDAPGLVVRGRATLRTPLTPFSQRTCDHLTEALRNLVWSRVARSVDERPDPPPRSYFGGHAWWLARADPTDADGLVVAAKGGHNGEPHNHNDCGSFVVHYRGESLLTDLGGATYDRDYFGERRYESLATRSLGHPVPYVDGSEQAVGEEHAATVLDRSTGADVESFAVDLADCYPMAALDSLERRFRLERTVGEAGRFTVEDRVRVGSEQTTPKWESVLVSYFPIQAVPRGFEVTGDRGRVVVDTGDADVAVEHLDDAMSVTPPGAFEVERRDVWRARVTGRSADSPLRLTVEPELR